MGSTFIKPVLARFVKRLVPPFRHLAGLSGLADFADREDRTVRDGYITGAFVKHAARKPYESVGHDSRPRSAYRS
jgi:hypothetical protein